MRKHYKLFRNNNQRRVRTWMMERMESDSMSTLTAEDAYQDYRDWANNRFKAALSKPLFGKALAICGIQSRKGSGGRMVYDGFVLRNCGPIEGESN